MIEDAAKSNVIKEKVNISKEDLKIGLKNINELPKEIRQLLKVPGSLFSKASLRHATFKEKSSGGIILLVLGFSTLPFLSGAPVLSAILILIGIFSLASSAGDKIIVDGNCPVCKTNINHKLDDTYKTTRSASFKCITCKKDIVLKDIYLIYFP
ncbi:hypothetical protein DS62_13510 [Smithella sp. SC_K08D17]|nr:hypothetical protein KD27_09415 [Smithella sp. D17]KIE18148.1 hypothetical protein DS62_13510 [Smithella sp. SC_K08D17]